MKVMETEQNNATCIVCKHCAKPERLTYSKKTEINVNVPDSMPKEKDIDIPLLEVGAINEQWDNLEHLV